MTDDIVTNEGITAWAQTLGNKRGWKKRMPEMPPGLPAGGEWSQTREGNVIRLRYRIDGKGHFIGEWAVDAPAEAPPTNGTGPRPAPAPRAPDPEPVALDPLIMLTPAASGAWRLNGYGVATADVIRALRLSLLHLVAKQSGALIIDEVISDTFAVVVPPARRTPPASKPAGQQARQPQAQPRPHHRRLP